MERSDPDVESHKEIAQAAASPPVAHELRFPSRVHLWRQREQDLLRARAARPLPARVRKKNGEEFTSKSAQWQPWSTGRVSRSNMNDSLSAQTALITGHNGDEVEAYVARPAGDGPRGGVVVIHHMPGYDRATKEIVRRFAELGYDTVCPNLYWREAPGAAPDDAAATARANGGVPDERLIGDVGGAAEWLRALPTSNQKAGVIGYCSGGRQS